MEAREKKEVTAVSSEKGRMEQKWNRERKSHQSFRKNGGARAKKKKIERERREKQLIKNIKY